MGIGRASGEAAHGNARRSVVPEAAGRSPWRAAVWTGLGAVVVCATLGIVAVAICWLPAAGSAGRASSAIRAGLLTFLASVHGGLAVDGVTTEWLPLGLLLIVGVTAWRAGLGLADAAEALGERDPLRLALVGLVQTVTFTIGALVAVPFATLGTSHAPFLGVGAGAFLLFAMTGGVAFIRSCALRGWVGQRVPPWVGPVLRGGAAALSVYGLAAALLVLGSLALHYDRVETLSRATGGGASGLPVLLLGILAAPNAVAAGIGYLTGPGFAVGSGTTASLFSTAHGTLPDFPLLGAVPTGHGANSTVWALAAIAAAGSGLAVARMALRVDGWLDRFGIAAGACLAAGFMALLLAWQAGGAVGSDRLRTVGASPWQTGAAVAVELLTVSAVWLGLVAGVRALWGNPAADDHDWDGPLFAPGPLLSMVTRTSGEAATEKIGSGAEHAEGESAAPKGDELAG